ncbi:predicted protein [Postia placenta Mad-698-R]|nr:predicted protein [Postia placenta Mad-698-R]
MNFFKSKPRTPPDLVRGLRDALPKLDVGPPGTESRRKANEDAAKNLQQIKAILYGDGDPLPELVAQLAQEVYATDLLYQLLLNIRRLEFEARKDVVQIFNNLLRRQIGARFPTVEYLNTHREALFAAFDGYRDEDVA